MTQNPNKRAKSTSPCFEFCVASETQRKNFVFSGFENKFQNDGADEVTTQSVVFTLLK